MKCLLHMFEVYFLALLFCSPDTYLLITDLPLLLLPLSLCLVWCVQLLVALQPITETLSLTVDGQSDRQTCHIAHRILHCAAVDVIICHQHPCDGQELLVRRQHEPRHIGQWLSTFEPLICSPGSIVMGAVEDDVFAELQYWWRLHVDIGPGYSLWIWATVDTIIFNVNRQKRTTPANSSSFIL